MDIKSIVSSSVHIVSEYYNNNLQPFFDNVDEDILWIGPAEKQWIQGRSELISKFEQEDHNLFFTVSNIIATPVSCNSSCCEVVLRFFLGINYEDGHKITRNQRFHLTWVEHTRYDENGKRERYPNIVVAHVSDAIAYDERDTIYPIHLKEVMAPALLDSFTGKRIMIKGHNQSMNYFFVNSIIWAESENNATGAVIHTINGVIHANESIPALVGKYPDCFQRIHRSYFINPLHVNSLCRLKITMSDGSELPIPAKKYMQVKQELTEFMEKI